MMPQPTASSESISIFNNTHPPLSPARLPPAARAAKNIPANPRGRGARTPALLEGDACAAGVGVLRGHQVPLQGRHCPSAGHRCPSAGRTPLSRCCRVPRGSSCWCCGPLRTLLEKREPPLKQWMSSASYSPGKREEPALAWVVSQLRTWAGKLKYVVLHMRNIF